MTLLAPEAIDFDDTWVLLESSLITILQDLGQGFPNDLWISLYTGVYKLCTKPMDPQHSKLYGRLKVRCDTTFDYVFLRMTMIKPCHFACCRAFGRFSA